MRVCVRAYVHVCVCACLRVCECACAIIDKWKRVDFSKEGNFPFYCTKHTISLNTDSLKVKSSICQLTYGESVFLCAFVRAFMRMCVEWCTCVRACVHACVRACGVRACVCFQTSENSRNNLHTCGVRLEPR